jgi:translocator protein
MKDEFIKRKIKYLIAVVAVFLVSFLGSLLTDQGMPWYNSLNLPEFTPEGSFIGIVWTIIFVLTLVSIILFLRNNSQKKELYFNAILTIFVLNGALNIFWSALFFGWGLIFWSIVEMVFLNLTTLALILLLWKRNKLSSVLLWPYFLWVSFATYLAYSIWLLN